MLSLVQKTQKILRFNLSENVVATSFCNKPTVQCGELPSIRKLPFYWCLWRLSYQVPALKEMDFLLT